MPEQKLRKNNAEKVVSPKVTLPVILQLIALAATTASTLSWDETQWVQSAMIVLTATAGYWIKDPYRGDES